ILFELGFWTVVLFPRRAWIYAVVGLTFHTTILFTMNINFLHHHGYTYLLFLFWPGRAKPVAAPPATEPGFPRVRAVSTAEKIFVYGMIVLFLGIDFGRVESWPFSDFRVFEARTRPEWARCFRVAGIDIEGRKTWIPRADLPRSETTLNAEFVRLFARKDADRAKAYLAEIAASIPPSKLTPYTAVGLFERRMSVAPDGTMTPVDTLIISIPVSPPPSR
ncbi:MAG: hypothetical protein K8T20_08675, partial [Planctomycetes bacterium]|nr:hypothetical protein [Planctomycetota bacterium]